MSHMSLQEHNLWATMEDMDHVWTKISCTVRSVQGAETNKALCSAHWEDSFVAAPHRRLVSVVFSCTGPLESNPANQSLK